MKHQLLFGKFSSICHVKIKMKTIKSLYLFLISSICIAQNVKLEGQFYPYSTYYISNFNLASGESSVPLFLYRVTSDRYPVNAKVYFKASFLSPQLGINERTILTEVESDVFTMKADILLDSKKFSENTTTLFDEDNPPNVVPILFRSIETINAAKYDNILSSIMTTGKLPDGEYRFELKMFSGPSELDLSMSDEKIETIIVETPSGVNLESPGGSIDDTTFNVVYTTYPFFNWNKGYCLNCETYIRVAEFRSDFHSSLEEALVDERVLPFDQSQEWLKLEDVSTFQYPLVGVRPLKNGKTYVWQIMVKIPTTDGEQNEVSEIYAFKVTDPSLSTKINSMDPLLLQIKEAIGENKYSELFNEGGSLEGYSPSGVYLIDGSKVDISEIRNALLRIKSKNLETIKIEDN